MTLNVPQPDPDVVSKGEFARRRGVSPGRVSQWIAAGQIAGAAIVGEGRAAQIRESVAIEQLRAKLDPMQMAGNGLSTSLKPAAAVARQAPLPAGADVLPFGPAPTATAPGVPPPATPTAGEAIEDEIKRLRRDQLLRAEREAQRQEAIAAGQLTDAGAAKAAAARETARLVTMFEGSLSNFATAIAAEFKLPQRDVLHLLRGEFRKFRGVVAAVVRDQAEAMPSVVEIEPGELEAAELETA